MSADKLKLFHEEIMQEEGIKISELPLMLQRQINGFNHTKKKLESNYTENDFLSLQKRAIKLGDAVQTFIENDYDDDDDDDNDDNETKKEEVKENTSKEKTPVETKTSNSNQENKKLPTDITDKKIKPVNTKFGNSMMEKKIMSLMESAGEKRISISQLQAIIGQQPDYPEQDVNNITLRKVFLSNDYRLV